MDMTTIYRVEDSEGIGPYSYEGAMQSDTDMFETHANISHPNPWVDTIKDTHTVQLRITDWEKCALESLEAVAHWFSGYGQDLTRHGYYVVAYSVPTSQVRFGNAQLVYDPASQIEVERFQPFDVID